MMRTNLIRLAVAATALCVLCPLVPPAAASDPCVTLSGGITACGSATGDGLTGTCTAEGTATASVTWDFYCDGAQNLHVSSTGAVFGPKSLTAGGCPVTAYLYANGVLVDSGGSC